MSQGPLNLTPIAYLEYQVRQKTTWCTPFTSLWRLSNLDIVGEGRRRELQGRGEVGTVGQRPPGFETMKRLVEERGFSEWGPEYVLGV